MKAFRAMGIFCFCGATCALYAAVTLAWPGTPLDGHCQVKSSCVVRWCTKAW